ncbi:MAG TPA: hypothetical protein QKA08_04160 [Candidatus Megaira endosymbiont of Nemacystus decipiens]|nr:hypothetical protein [Candidatus Megaera endosymbiont of Nemacystus decipiens]
MLSRLPMNLFQDNFYDEHLINMEILTCIENENLEELKNIIESYQTSHLIDLSYEEGLFYIRAAQNNRYDVLNYLCNKNKELAKKYSYEMLAFALTDNKEDCIKYIIQNLEPDYSPLKQTRYKCVVIF